MGQLLGQGKGFVQGKVAVGMGGTGSLVQLQKGQEGSRALLAGPTLMWHLLGQEAGGGPATDQLWSGAHDRHWQGRQGMLPPLLHTDL